jgi:purine-nucleoside phosphorylase
MTPLSQSITLQADIMTSAQQTIQSLWPDLRPVCAVILGSGWNTMFGEYAEKASIAYSRIPGLGATSVAGHAGRLSWIEIDGADVIAFNGRRHYYEGEGWAPMRTMIKLIKGLGARTLVVTNAVGGIRTDLTGGSLMLVEDHINLMGSNPLIGPHDPDFGERFPCLSRVYDRELMQLLADTAARSGLKLARGIYVAVSGPAYETPAEVRAYRSLGADAVGMSLVPEVVLAGAAGLRVIGLSCIANKAVDLDTELLTHTEVLETTSAAVKKMGAIFPEFIRALAERISVQ